MMQITLMEAYLVEILRSKGITNEEIINYVSEKRVDELQKHHESFDFQGLYNIENLDKILQEGYKIKFLTMPGLVNMLRMKYGKEPENDFLQKETSLENLSLTDVELADLEKWLATNWKIIEKNGTISIVPRYEQS